MEMIPTAFAAGGSKDLSAVVHSNGGDPASGNVLSRTALSKVGAAAVAPTIALSPISDFVKIAEGELTRRSLYGGGIKVLGICF
jgi:hypothetical protein